MPNEKETIKIAYLGGPSSFSHQALSKFEIDFFKGKEIESLGQKSFPAIAEQIISRKANYGIIPLENSSIGSISANYDLLWHNPIYIVSETFIVIHHHLIAIAGSKIDDIEQVYSHPAAIDQCQKLFLAYPKMKPVVHWDTSSAVKLILESKDMHLAAIASKLTVNQESLTILKNNIEDFAGNTTRFVLVSNKETAQLEMEKTSAASKGCKISIACELEHKPGSLSILLSEIAQIGANLTKVESRPIPETPWHYRFFIDIAFSEKYNLQEITDIFIRHCNNWKMNGIYNSI